MYKKILLAYNASKHSAEALRQAARLAVLCNSELHLLGIVVTTGSLAIVQASSNVDVIGQERIRITQALDDAVAELRSRGIEASRHIGEGDAAEVIVAKAVRLGADLIVIGHSNKGALARWFQSSPGARLLGHLPCNLLISAK